MHKIDCKAASHMLAYVLSRLASITCCKSLRACSHKHTQIMHCPGAPEPTSAVSHLSQSSFLCDLCRDGIYCGAGCKSGAKWARTITLAASVSPGYFIFVAIA